MQNPVEYVEINEMLGIYGRPIVARSAYHTHGISIHKIMEPSLKEIQYLTDTKRYLRFC